MIVSFNALPFSPPTQATREPATPVNDSVAIKPKDQPINFLAALAALFPGMLPQTPMPPPQSVAVAGPIASGTTEAAPEKIPIFAPHPSDVPVAVVATPKLADAPAPVMTTIAPAPPPTANDAIPSPDPAPAPIKTEKPAATIVDPSTASALAAAIAPIAVTPTSPPRSPVETASANRRTAPPMIATTSPLQLRARETFDAEITLPTTTDGTASFQFHRETLSAIAPTPAKGDSAEDGDADPASTNTDSPRPSFEAQAAPSRAESPRPAPPLGEQVRVQIHDNLDQVRQTGRADLRMDLQPPELGKMRLHLTLQDDNLHVRLTVQDEGVKRLLDQQLEPLRVHFAEMGVSIGQFDVRSDGGSAYQNPDQDAGPPTKITKTAPAIRRSYMVAESSESRIDVFA